MNIKSFFDSRTFTLTYVVFDPISRDAIIMDPVLDYDPASSQTWTQSVDEVIAFASSEQLRVHYILETHAHADHLSGAQRLKQACPIVKLGIGRRIVEVQQAFAQLFAFDKDFATNGSQFDLLLADGDTFEAGSLRVHVLATPGHTPACSTYKIADAVFTGDALFMPDSGTGRCDFPGGSAAELYRSLTQKIYTLPNQTRVFVGHDYQPNGRRLAFETTVGTQKLENIALQSDTTEQQFVQFRQKRDASLRAPLLMFQSVQVNINAGKLPTPEKNGQHYLRIPINAFKSENNQTPLSVTCHNPLDDSTQN